MISGNIKSISVTGYGLCICCYTLPWVWYIYQMTMTNFHTFSLWFTGYNTPCLRINIHIYGIFRANIRDTRSVNKLHIRAAMWFSWHYQTTLISFLCCINQESLLFPRIEYIIYNNTVETKHSLSMQKTPNTTSYIHMYVANVHVCVFMLLRIFRSTNLLIPGKFSRSLGGRDNLLFSFLYTHVYEYICVILSVSHTIIQTNKRTYSRYYIIQIVGGKRLVTLCRMGNIPNIIVFYQ